MRRKTKIETTIHHERWLISYSDFVTLLFAFFVVMYSISQVNENKYRQLAQTLDFAFDPKNSHLKKESDLSDGTKNKASTDSSEIQSLQEKLSDSLSHLVSQGSVVLNGTENWTDISLDAELFFLSGSANIEADAKQTFIDLSQILKSYDNSVAIAGHTDNLPINNALYQNNWALSAARAVAVVHFFENEGISPQRLSAIGYGEHRPIVENTSDINRRKNRRVVLRVSNSSAIDTLGQGASPNAQLVLSEALLPEENNTEENNTDEREKIGERSPSNTIVPVKLKDGGLLFTSDPDLPRFNYDAGASSETPKSTVLEPGKEGPLQQP